MIFNTFSSKCRNDSLLVNVLVIENFRYFSGNSPKSDQNPSSPTKIKKLAIDMSRPSARLWITGMDPNAQSYDKLDGQKRSQ